MVITDLFWEYAVPAALVLANVAVAVYFRKRSARVKGRKDGSFATASRVWKALAAGWGILYAVAVITGAVEVDLVTAIGFLATPGAWGLAFAAVVRDEHAVPKEKPDAVLAIGAHPDDIELGCGGTLSRYKKLGFKVYGLVVTSGEWPDPSTKERGDREREAEHGASILGLDRIWVYHFRDKQLYSQVNEIKAAIEGKIRQTGARIVITQSPHDAHQDHKAVFEATKSATQGDRTILCYEDVTTESHFAANYFVDISKHLDEKIRAVQAHRTQRGKTYAQPEQISGRAANRGLQTGVRFAEAFLLYNGKDPLKSL